MTTETQSPQHQSLVEALAAAQAEFPSFEKDKQAKIKTRGGSEYSYKYASLDAVLTACRPVLSKHGLAISWVFESGEGHGYVVTRLLWGNDQLESRLPAYGDGDMQSLGSAITYAKRYGLCGLIGVTAEEDDDGANAGKRPSAHSRGNSASGEDRERPPSRPPGPLTIEELKGYIRSKKTPDELLALVEQVAGGENVSKDPPLFKQFLVECGKYTTANLQSKVWSEVHTALLDQRVDELFKATSEPQQQDLLNDEG